MTKLPFPYKKAWIEQLTNWSNDGIKTAEQLLFVNIIAQAIMDARSKGEEGYKQTQQGRGELYAGFMPHYCKFIKLDIDFVGRKVLEAWDKTNKVAV